MRKNPFQKSSRLAFRSAVYSALCIGTGVGIAAKFLLGSTLTASFVAGGVFFVLSGITVYLIIYTQQFSRLETLNQINKNILKKRFHDYEELQTKNNDELDYLIKQTVRASKTVEREIQRLNRIENYRKEFIGDISHELKTPIFAIQGFIETLLNGAIDDEEVNRKFLEKAMRNVNRLIYLTKDLMAISKLETGELKSDIQDINLGKIITDVVDNLQYKAKKDVVSLKTKDIPEHTFVTADRNQIKQVLTNLVENAIKYNYKGGLVTVGVKDYPKNKNRVLVYVKDTGIGISQQYIERVTERFFRVDKSRSRDKGGTGLGLAIVKHIMEAHDEEFFIESTPSVGSTFSFTLSKVDRTPAEAELTN
ncbi:sensor histidine kinase [Fodinibius sp. SL11]|uniref:sensor histidine kinase n=1 Tax=Fodinibius sp. SL11 TaxID=3425690 RepID=UPI003F8844AB